MAGAPRFLTLAQYLDLAGLAWPGLSLPELAWPELAWQAAHDPCVPTLCLTSEEDSVIPAPGVRAFADGLRAAQPARQVRAPNTIYSSTQY